MNNLEIVPDLDSNGAPVAPLITAEDTDQYRYTLSNLIKDTGDYTSTTSGNIEGKVNQGFTPNVSFKPSQQLIGGHETYLPSSIPNFDKINKIKTPMLRQEKLMRKEM